MSIIDNTYSFCGLVSIPTSPNLPRAKRRRAALDYGCGGTSIGAQLVRPDIRQSSSLDSAPRSRTSTIPAIASDSTTTKPISAAVLRSSVSRSSFSKRLFIGRRRGPRRRRLASRAMLARGDPAGTGVIERAFHGAGGQQLGQRLSRRPARAVDRIERNAVATEILQISGQRRVWSRPVAAHRYDIRSKQSARDRVAIEHRRLVDLAGQTPGRGHVDKHGLALADQLEDRVWIEPAPRTRRCGALVLDAGEGRPQPRSRYQRYRGCRGKPRCKWRQPAPLLQRKQPEHEGERGSGVESK